MTIPFLGSSCAASKQGVAIASGQKITIFFTRKIKLPTDYVSHELFPFSAKNQLFFCVKPCKAVPAAVSQSMVWRQELQFIKKRSSWAHWTVSRGRSSALHTRHIPSIKWLELLCFCAKKPQEWHCLSQYSWEIADLATVVAKPRARSRINTIAAMSLQNKDQKLYSHYVHFHCTLFFVTEATLDSCILF